MGGDAADIAGPGALFPDRDVRLDRTAGNGPVAIVSDDTAGHVVAGGDIHRTGAIGDIQCRTALAEDATGRTSARGCQRPGRMAVADGNVSQRLAQDAADGMVARLASGKTLAVNPEPEMFRDYTITVAR